MANAMKMIQQGLRLQKGEQALVFWDSNPPVWMSGYRDREIPIWCVAFGDANDPDPAIRMRLMSIKIPRYADLLELNEMKDD